MRSRSLRIPRHYALPITCPKCGKEFKKGIGRIEVEPKLICIRCKAAIDPEPFRREIKAADAAFAAKIREHESINDADRERERRRWDAYWKSIEDIEESSEGDK